MMKQKLEFVVRIVCAGLFVWLAAASPTWCQAPPGPLPPKPGVTPEKAPPQQQEKKPNPGVRVTVDLVNTPVTVRDSKGELVLNLSQKDFRVFDNGVEQRIDHFDLGGDPLSIVLVVETSSRIEPLLPAVRQAGIVFSQIVMGETGEAAVVGYDDAASVVQPFAKDPDQIQKSIEHLREGTSGARLYDAFSVALGLLQKRPPNERRVVLAMAEAADTGSESRLGEVLREAQLSNITIYTIGLSTTAAELRAKPKQYSPPEISPPGTFPMPPMPGTPQTPSTEAQRYGNMDLLALAVWVVQHAASPIAHNRSLEVSATATGGAHLNTFKDRSIEQALDQIGGELHAQYMLSYRPPGEEPPGYHEIKVTVSRPGVKVRTRPGYYLAPPLG